jgi:hypothetical protein
MDYKITKSSAELDGASFIDYYGDKRLTRELTVPVAAWSERCYQPIADAGGLSKLFLDFFLDVEERGRCQAFVLKCPDEMLA